MKAHKSVWLVDGSWKQSHSVGVDLVSSSDTFNRYTIDLGSNSNYTGKLAALRIDPIDTMSTADTTYTVEIDKITFIAEEETAAPGILEWDFDDNTTQGWGVANGTDKGVTDGVYKVGLSYTNTDTWVQRYGLEFAAADYTD